MVYWFYNATTYKQKKRLNFAILQFCKNNNKNKKSKHAINKGTVICWNFNFVND
jgi:hypothetical protein